MPDYSGIQKEETLKGLVYKDFFSQFGYEPNIDNIDFVVTDKKAHDDLFSVGPGSSFHYLWAEAKKGTHDLFEMFTQLLLTCKKTYEKAEHLAPPWLGCFDEARIAFISFHDILPLFNEADINWTQTPSSHETIDFQKAQTRVKNIISAKIAAYNFGTDDGEIKEFIKTHFILGQTSLKSPITKDNFVQIFIKWVKEVKPSINVGKDEWAEFKQKGILDCDFYRADMMSEGGNTITEKLKIILKNDNYKFQENISGRLFTSDIGFTDDGEAYSRFWNKYERPPAPVFRQFIIDRRDLLVPQNIREVKGSFFTPAIWANKSKEYIAKVFGDDWQDEYFVWDCAAGTGNLLAGLSNEYNVWASDIDAGNVETMQSLIDIDDNLRLLPGHVFQFDFLNDDFDKMPEELKKIIDDPEKRKKLIIYINPPYAEGDNRKGEGRSGVAVSKIQNKYSSYLGYTKREIYIQFLARIYFEIPGCKIGEFSTLTGLTGPKFIEFRNSFNAKLISCFMVRANTFDNVKGEFPIGFKIWDAKKKAVFHKTEVDVFDDNGVFVCKKIIYAYTNEKVINDWTITFIDDSKESIGNIIGVANDFQHQNTVCIEKPNKPWNHQYQWQITRVNFIESCIYYTVRKCIEHTWINHNDQFLFPNNDWKIDEEFKINCVLYTVFGSKNFFSTKYGINHWIPFTEKEVSAKEKFESNFMSKFLKDKTFSAEAQTVFDAGRELWKYYHAKIKNNKTASVNASFYDIRAFFQGRNDKGTMKTKSDDETYNALIKTLRGKLDVLSLKIQPKVYEYGFLKE
jgi:hypothetical protein